ncbi:MAG: divalent-cation tolerance protein CutA [Candidatus Curtissbacteria bacterium]|nr:divalent-cation tolerance protein CutA [Candidatus Curtissbacteria bacterium]
MILILTTFPNKTEAVKIGEAILDEKLAVCWNLFPVDSNYRWKGKIVKDKELLMIIKTKDENFEKIEDFIKKNHSYEVPEIISVKANKINASYLAWVNQETS